MNTGAAVVEAIVESGVRRFYTVPGESFMEVLDAVEQHPKTRLFSTRHESGASFMAEADAKLTGVPAVAMATRGPGASNLSIGVQTAFYDATPMLVLLGDVETTHRHRRALQEVDLSALYAPITKLSMTATRSDRLPEMIDHALRVAMSGRPGPVMIALPPDLLAAELPMHTRRTSSGPIHPTPTPSHNELAETIRALTEAVRPVIIAGAGSQDATPELVNVAETYGVGVYAAFRRQDVFPNDHPLYLGHLGVAPSAMTLVALTEADVVLILGCDLDQVTSHNFTLPSAQTRVIQVDRDPETIGANVSLSLGVVSDVREMLRALLEHAPKRSYRKHDWGDAHRAYLCSSTPGVSRSVGGIDPAAVITSMSREFPSDTIVTSDAGNFALFLHRYWSFQHPHSQAAPTNGAMGYAVPGAVGAKAAFPDRKVVAVAGDGGFLMTGQEIETAVRYGLSLTVVVLRNGLYGTIAMHQIRQFGRTAAVNIGSVNLATFARSFGCAGLTVEKPGDLDAAMAHAANSPGVTVLDVTTDPDLISPTETLSGLLAKRSSVH